MNIKQVGHKDQLRMEYFFTVQTYFMKKCKVLKILYCTNTVSTLMPDLPMNQ
jgi:hypothetical protein